MVAIKFDSNKFDRKQSRMLSKSKKSLDKLYETFYKEVARIGATTGFDDPERDFFLKDYPKADKAMQALLLKLCDRITGLIEDGCQKGWSISNAKNSALINALGNIVPNRKDFINRINMRSESALNSFQDRKVNGLGLSERVWKSQQQVKGQIELALELGLAEGKSAPSLSRDVRSYLREPEKLFRRVRDKKGHLRLSKSAAAYHPGQGVYRSSYKNALRMTVTENNIAYRTADFVQQQEMDFVIGIEIRLSDNHPCDDICDDLAGVYPKKFKFTGWHPFCRCYTIPKLAEREELNKWARMGKEERAGYHFKGEVRSMPKKFTDWVDRNAERIKSAKSLPYFYRDNKDMIIQQTTPKQKEIIKLATERHAARTPEHIATIQERWNTRRLQGISEQFYGLNLSSSDPLTGRFFNLLMHTNSPSFAEDFSVLKTDVQKAWDAERKAVEKIQRQLGIKKGKHSKWAQDMLKQEATNASRAEEFVTSTRHLIVAKKSKACNISTTRGGIQIAKPVSCRSQAYNPTDFLKPLSQLPIELRGTLERIDLVDWYNLDDLYWRKVYKNFTRSWATGGNGTVTFYRNTKAEAASNDLLSTLSHECGHNLDRKYGGSGWFSDEKSWQDAKAADKKKSSQEAVTEYGKNSPHEDFAESCKLYVTNPSKLKTTFPNRYKIIRALLYRY